MTAPHWDLEELQGWVGREETYVAPDQMGSASFRYYAMAIGDDNPLYTDPATARSAGYGDVIAPPTLVCETNQYIPHPVRDADGYIGHGWDLPIRDCRLIRGGNRYDFTSPVHPEDTIVALWRIEAIEEKASSRGVMLIVTSVARYKDTHGKLKVTNTETLIYQPLAPTGGGA